MVVSSGISSPFFVCSKTRALNDGVLIWRSTWLGTMSFNLHRTQSLEFKPPKQRPPHRSFPRACSLNSDDKISDEEFSRKIQELALRFQISDETSTEFQSDMSLSSPLMESRWLEIPPEIEMKANSVDLPLSLRMIKRKKKQWQEEFFIEARESAYCSIKKAFSSMVFIIRELHSYTLQMRELLFFEDLQGIISRVQGEIQASFVWLFQQVFSHTPTLMVFIMILLANFTVHSISTSAAIAAAPPPISATVEVTVTETSRNSFSVSSSPNTKTTTFGGNNNNGGGNNAKPVASGPDRDGRSDRITPEEVSVSGQEAREEEEVEVWNSVLEEASRMKGHVREDSMYVSPVTAKMDGDDEYEEYLRTELVYQTGLAQEPNNVLLLTNYAQFLYLVAHDYDRAEEYFKRGIGVEPKDAEAHSKYAHFLWQVRNDLWAAEETFLEAISVDPTNSFYAANYAHFLWNTGGEDTCFPLNSPHDQDTLDT